MVKQNKKLSQNPALPRKKEIMSREEAAFEAQVVQDELKELQEELNTTLLNEEDEMATEFNGEGQKEVKVAKAEGEKTMCSENFDKNKQEQPKESPLWIIEESLQKNAKRHREKVFKILMGVLESRTKNIYIDNFTPRFAYMEPWQRDVVDQIVEEYKNSGKFFPIITNLHYEVLVGNTIFHAAEELGLEYIPAIRIFALAEESFAIYWQALTIFATKLGIEQWEFLRMQLKEFKGIGQ